MIYQSQNKNNRQEPSGVCLFPARVSGLPDSLAFPLLDVRYTAVPGRQSTNPIPYRWYWPKSELICKINTRRLFMLNALSVLWGGFAVWGLTTVIVRQFRLRVRRERQAQCVSLALAELERRRQPDHAA